MKYAVTAATGNFGQAAVKALGKLTDKSNIIVIARNQEKANKFFPDFEVREGNYDDVDSMTKALNGVDRVLFISSQPGGKVSRDIQHKHVVQALQNAGVDFVAYTSFPDAQNSVSALAADHKMTEQLSMPSCGTTGTLKMKVPSYKWVLTATVIVIGLTATPVGLWNVNLRKRLPRSLLPTIPRMFTNLPV